MTFDFEDIERHCFLDTETRACATGEAVGDVKQDGTYRYAKNAFVIVSTFAIGGQPVFDVSLDRGFDGDWLCWDEMPLALREFHKRVEQREARYVAFNAGFDRAVWNEGTWDFPKLAPDMILDAMAQSLASNLPPSLEGASQALGLGGKLPEGKKLIDLFCARGGATPQDRPADWERFKLYGRIDTTRLREVWQGTRKLTPDEWEDYWVSERINDRGIRIDVELARRAALVAAADVRRSNALLTRWTNGQVTKVTQTARLADWAYTNISDGEPKAMLVSEYDEDAVVDEDGQGDVKVVSSVSLARARIEAVLAYYANKAGPRTEREQLVIDVLTVRQFGGSSSPAKFEKMVRQHDGGRLKGQYVFNGAGQTGRFSSKGVQVHNLLRATLDRHEAAAIEMINELERLT